MMPIFMAAAGMPYCRDEIILILLRLVDNMDFVAVPYFSTRKHDEKRPARLHDAQLEIGTHHEMFCDSHQGFT